MKVTIGELVSCREAFARLAALELPIKASYWIGKKLGKVDSELKHFEKKRSDLIQKLGEPGENGTVKVKDENVVEFHTQMGELMGLEVDLDVEPIKLADIEGSKLSSADLMTLDRFIVE